VLVFQNSKHRHNWGQEATPEALVYIFKQVISRLIDFPYLEDLELLLFQSCDFSIGAGVSKFAKWS